MDSVILEEDVDENYEPTPAEIDEVPLLCALHARSGHCHIAHTLRVQLNAAQLTRALCLAASMRRGLG